MLLMLSAAPVVWKGNSGLKLRDLIVEISRLVLGPEYLFSVDHHPASGAQPIPTATANHQQNF